MSSIPNMCKTGCYNLAFLLLLKFRYVVPKECVYFCVALWPRSKFCSDLFLSVQPRDRRLLFLRSTESKQTLCKKCLGAPTFFMSTHINCICICICNNLHRMQMSYSILHLPEKHVHSSPLPFTSFFLLKPIKYAKNTCMVVRPETGF